MTATGLDPRVDVTTLPDALRQRSEKQPDDTAYVFRPASTSPTSLPSCPTRRTPASSTPPRNPWASVTRSRRLTSSCMVGGGASKGGSSPWCSHSRTAAHPRPTVGKQLDQAQLIHFQF